MELTREEAISWHRKMWNWIADRIEEEKEFQYIGILKEEYCKKNNITIRNECFCCEFANGNCYYCPLNWDSNLAEYMCEQKYEEDDDRGLYSLCCEVKNDWKRQAKLAREIASIQEKEVNNENRLTYITELGACLDKDSECPTCSICWNCNIPVKECPYIYDAIEKLAEYEDTELSPRQVLQLKGCNIEKKPDIEGDGCDQEGNLIYDTWICPSCNEYYEIDCDEYDFCPKCGQRIDRRELH